MLLFSRDYSEGIWRSFWIAIYIKIEVSPWERSRRHYSTYMVWFPPRAFKVYMCTCVLKLSQFVEHLLQRLGECWDQRERIGTACPAFQGWLGVGGSCSYPRGYLHTEMVKKAPSSESARAQKGSARDQDISRPLGILVQGMKNGCLWGASSGCLEVMTTCLEDLPTVNLCV